MTQSKAIRKSRDNDSIERYVNIEDLPEEIQDMSFNGEIYDAFYEDGDIVFVDQHGDEHKVNQ